MKLFTTIDVVENVDDKCRAITKVEEGILKINRMMRRAKEIALYKHPSQNG